MNVQTTWLTDFGHRHRIRRRFRHLNSVSNLAPNRRNRRRNRRPTRENEPSMLSDLSVIRTFGKVLMLTHFLKVLMLHHVLFQVALLNDLSLKLTDENRIFPFFVQFLVRSFGLGRRRRTRKKFAGLWPANFLLVFFVPCAVVAAALSSPNGPKTVRK